MTLQLKLRFVERLVFVPQHQPGTLAVDPCLPLQQLDIYQAPTSPTVLVASASPLQAQVGQLRETLETTLSSVKSHAQRGTQAWIGWEGDVGGASSHEPAPAQQGGSKEDSQLT